MLIVMGERLHQLMRVAQRHPMSSPCAFRQLPRATMHCIEHATKVFVQTLDRGFVAGYPYWLADPRCVTWSTSPALGTKLGIPTYVSSRGN